MTEPKCRGTEHWEWVQTKCIMIYDALLNHIFWQSPRTPGAMSRLDHKNALSMCRCNPWSRRRSGGKQVTRSIYHRHPSAAQRASFSRHIHQMDFHVISGLTVFSRALDYTCTKAVFPPVNYHIRAKG